MALYLIGLGLNDEKDITVKGLEAIKNCESVYLENYTSVLQIPVLHQHLILHLLIIDFVNWSGAPIPKTFCKTLHLFGSPKNRLP